MTKKTTVKPTRKNSLEPSELSRVSLSELNAFFAETFQGEVHLRPEVTSVSRNHVTIKLVVSEEHLRPGGFISGPTQMALADQVAYCAIFTFKGIIPMAVTSNLSIDFLRPCIGEAIIVKASVLKNGKTLAVMSVDIFGSASDKLASRATVTYSLPAPRP